MNTRPQIDISKLTALVTEAWAGLPDEQRERILVGVDKTGGLQTEREFSSDGTSLTIRMNGVAVLTVPTWQVSASPPRPDA